MSKIPYIAASFIPMVIGLPFSSVVEGDESHLKMLVGQVYPIAEKDALAEIEGRVERYKHDPEIFGEEDDWSALKSPSLPVAETYAKRQVIPFFALSFDIPDKDGNVLYPAGYTFNPLEYLRLPSKLIIVNEAQLFWAIETASAGDMILLAGGNALAAGRNHERPVFKLEDQVRERLALRVVPSVVEQVDTHFVVEELPLDENGSAFSLDSDIEALREVSND